MSFSKNDLLEVRGLKTYFETTDGSIPAVDGIDFTVQEGETVALVGESGCGKSVTALSIMRLISRHGHIRAGEILFQGKDLLKLSRREMCGVRGDAISMVFQEPMTSLNPVLTIGEQISEAIRLHNGLGAGEARERTIQMLKQVHIPEPDRRYKSFPHELSGGMRQRVMIAMALSCNPSLLIADEPTTALDVTIQAQILELLKELKHALGLSILLITHDLGVVAEIADRVVVMYVGRIVEEAQVKPLYACPKHPYSQGLLASIPSLTTSREQELHVIRGSVPNLYQMLPPGCRFASRCPQAFNMCKQSEPELVLADKDHRSRCWLHMLQK